MMRQKRLNRNSVLVAIVAFLIFPSSSSNAFAAQKATKQKKQSVKKRLVTVIDLHNIEQVKEAFQRDAGKVRLVTILSPT